MSVINQIVSELKDFIEFFQVKYKYDQRGILKRYRLKSGLNKQLSDEIWYELFLKKSSYNYCAKILLMRFWEDTGKISSKLNMEGITKWQKLVTNIKKKYGLLYKIAELDIMHSEELKDIFKKNDYDIYEMDDELSEFIIEKLKKYDFGLFDYETIYNIFNYVYMNDKNAGPNLQYFYKPASAIDYVLSIKKHKENLV